MHASESQTKKNDVNGMNSRRLFVNISNAVCKLSIFRLKVKTNLNNNSKNYKEQVFKNISRIAIDSYEL